MHNTENKKLQNITASILFINTVKTFKRVGKPDLHTQDIGLITEDNQKLFCEIRSNNFDKVKFMRVKHNVKVSFYFAGSEKNGKHYNNIIVSDINVI